MTTYTLDDIRQAVADTKAASVDFNGLEDVGEHVTQQAALRKGGDPDTALRDILRDHPSIGMLLACDDLLVLPIIDAIAAGRDGEAEAKAARASGLNIYLSGVCHELHYDEDPPTQDAFLYNNASVAEMHGGEVILHQSASITKMNDGIANLLHSAFIAEMHGGIACLCSPDARVINHIGGDVIRYKWRDGKHHEISRVTK